ncbi:MAG: hypothetical protein KatS3mg082_1399 [Nitrospiraceae bacterium]|nr:MAG: hypothetical protein KatS3mg082_1399 [Nitrospiraceae bacterium]
MMLRYARFLLRERDVQRAVVELCRLYGGVVYSLSQGYRPGPRRHATTRQTKGLPDLWVFFPARKVGMWIEGQAAGRRQDPRTGRFRRPMRTDRRAVRMRWGRRGVAGIEEVRRSLDYSDGVSVV